MEYKIFERNGLVTLERPGLPESHKSKRTFHEFGSLTASHDASGKITISKGVENVVYKISFVKILGEDGQTLSTSGPNTSSDLNDIFKGKSVRVYEMSGYSTDSSFSDDVSYIEFPSPVASDISNNLISESVCFGELGNSVEGESNTLNLRNLSTGSKVRIDIDIQCNVSAATTFSFTSGSSQFGSISDASVGSFGSDVMLTFNGTSTVSNKSDWKLSGSLTTDGSGTYRIKRVKITITK